MIVLDTNVISEMQGRTHSERILSWLDAYDVETLFLTTIAVAETVSYTHLTLPTILRV